MLSLGQQVAGMVEYGPAYYLCSGGPRLRDSPKNAFFLGFGGQSLIPGGTTQKHSQVPPYLQLAIDTSRFLQPKLVTCSHLSKFVGLSSGTCEQGSNSGARKSLEIVVFLKSHIFLFFPLKRGSNFQHP